MRRMGKLKAIMDSIRECLYNLITDKYQGVVATIFKLPLFLLSLIYGLIVRILIFWNRLRPYRPDCKVISVGNITLGGTGKTSLVEFIARCLKQKNYKVAIVTRGYKRKLLETQQSAVDYEAMGDEPYMLSKKLSDIPVLVDMDRERALKQAIEEYRIDTAILYDGFQQWRLKKDLEIVAIDATDPFGNSYLLPRGILREPLSSLKRADIFVLTKTNLNPDIQDIKDFLNRINPSAEIFESVHKPVSFYSLNRIKDVLNINVLKGKNVTLFSGIGNPDSFENLALSLGINIGLSFRLPDHHNYTQKDLEKIIRRDRKSVV